MAGTVTRATGGCLCGAVSFTIDGPLRDVSFCHCVMCQRASSNVAAYTACAPTDLHLGDQRHLRWYRSSPTARRGFCGRCGSQLLWVRDESDHISVSAGSLDQPTGLTGGRHIFCEQAADYAADRQPRASGSG